MTKLCQMEILNFLWLNWVQYPPLASTQIDIPPKGQLISKQIYEVIISPKKRTKYCKDFVRFLGEMMTFLRFTDL